MYCPKCMFLRMIVPTMVRFGNNLPIASVLKPAKIVVPILRTRLTPVTSVVWDDGKEQANLASSARWRKAERCPLLGRPSTKRWSSTLRCRRLAVPRRLPLHLSAYQFPSCVLGVASVKLSKGFKQVPNVLFWPSFRATEDGLCCLLSA